MTGEVQEVSIAEALLGQVASGLKHRAALLSENLREENMEAGGFQLGLEALGHVREF